MSDHRQKAERRRHYRTRVSASLGLDTRVLAPDGNEVVGELLDVSVGGAGVRLPRTPTPPLHAGEPVALELRAPGMSAPIVVRAVAQRCVLAAHGYLYGLRFLETLELGSAATIPVREAFNRRRLVRVHPAAPGLRAVVIPEGHASGSVVLAVADISAGGLAVTAPTQAHMLLGRHYDFGLELSLPSQPGSLHLVAHVRYRVRERTTWRYGLELDRYHSEAFATAQRLIADYVSGILREQSSRSGRG